MDWNTTEKNTQHDSPVHVHIEEDPGDSDGIEIPSCLIVANVTDSVFQGGSDRVRSTALGNLIYMYWYI